MHSLKFRYFKIYLIFVAIHLWANFIFAQTDSLQIIYLANVSAAFENCGCGEDPLGGLDRIAYLIQQKRSQNPQVLFIDGGDFTNSYPYDALNSLIIQIYQRLKPDIMLLADQELQKNNAFVIDQLRKTKFRFIASNYRLNKLSLKKKAILNLGNRKIAFLSFLDKSSFAYQQPQPIIKFDTKQFKKLYQQVIKTTAFQIAIFHGEEWALDGFVQQFPQFDLILFAHTQRLVEHLQTHPFVVSAGSDGEYLNLITLSFSNLKSVSISLNRIPVRVSLPVDSKVEKWINNFKQEWSK